MTIARFFARWLGHRPNVRYAIKHRLLMMYHNPDKAKSERFMTDFYGMQYEGNVNSYIDWCIYYLGAYCRQELCFLKTLANQLPTDSVFVDVGANVGNHSLYASTVFGHVYSFEPVPWLVERIRRQQQLNAIDNLSVYPYALGESDARHAFYCATMANQGTGSLIKGRENHVKAIVVDVKQGDQFLESLDLTRLDVIKIDVEGYERPVLTGLARIIANFQPIIFFEWSESAFPAHTPLIDSPYFEGYSFYVFTEGELVGFFFEEDTFNLRSVDVLIPNNNYVAVPAGKIPLLGPHIKAVGST